VCEFSLTVIFSFSLNLCAQSSTCVIHNTTHLAHAQHTPWYITHHIPLQVACNSIAEVRGGEVQLYKTMGYDKFLTEREERAARAMAEWQAMERERAKMQDFVDRMGKRQGEGGGLRESLCAGIGHMLSSATLSWFSLPIFFIHSFIQFSSLPSNRRQSLQGHASPGPHQKAGQARGANENAGVGRRSDYWRCRESAAFEFSGTPTLRPMASPTPGRFLRVRRR